MAQDVDKRMCPEVSNTERIFKTFKLGAELHQTTKSKGLITLCVVSLAFLICPHVFPRKEKCKKNEKKLPNARIFSILHYALGKNPS